MRNKVGQFVLAVSLALLIGGHWAILQSVAWIGMTLRQAQSVPLTEALIKTFDGQHPCQLCKFVKDGKKTERKNPTINLLVKFEFVHELEAGALFHQDKYPAALPVADSSRSFSETPPAPPPRFHRA